MKKEAINIFNQGLNKDLNTIVVPNNILTDSLNGTFLTYNGDELSLQNDSGNTLIEVADTGDFVRLSEGFYPLGIREYGGVLYIVSGKKGLNEDGTTNHDLDEIEFGSYPSPELASYTTFHGQLSIALNNTNDVFYKSFVINRDYFKTGRYISFVKQGEVLDMSNVWTYWDHKGLYIIKLFLQLDNGMIDLTDDVWQSFIAYKQEHPEDTSLHWLLSPNFTYYCPYSYKGRLVVEVVFSEPTFEPIKYYELETGDNVYNFKMDVKVGNTEALEIVGYNIEIITDAIPFVGDTVNDKVTNVKTYKSPQYTIPESGVISVSESIVISKVVSNEILFNKMMHYSITPIFKYINSGEILDWGSLPIEFKEKYTIKSYVLLGEKYNSVGFNIEESECVPKEGKKSIKVISLIGEEGHINTDLEPELLDGNPYVFHEFNYTPKIKCNKIGYFTTNQDGSISTVEVHDGAFSNSLIQTAIVNKLMHFPILVVDPYCGQATIRLQFSAPLEMETATKVKNGSLTIYQESSTTMLPYESTDGRNFTVYIDSTKNVDINFYNPSYGNTRFTILKENLNFVDPYKIGLILDFTPTYIDKDVVEVSELIFYTPDLEPTIDELGTYIHSLFDTTIPNRVEIVKTGTSDPFEVFEGRMYFVKEADSRYFDMIIKGDNLAVYSRTVLRYEYEIINAPGIVPGEYTNIQDLQTPGYVKLGSEHHGYLLFKRKSQFMPVMLSGSYRTSTTGTIRYNSSGRSSVGGR